MVTDEREESGMMDRRDFVRTAAGAALATKLDWMRAAFEADASLRAKAAAKGILFGSAADGRTLLPDQAFQQVFIRECAILTPEYELKFGTLRPGPTRFNFEPADTMLQWCQTNGIKMRGHTLAFWESIPGWFKAYTNSSNARDLLTNHIQTVVGRYAGKLHSWDVLNEAINPADHNPDGLKNSPWLTFIGPDYIPLAFQTARAADPSALLVYNDFGIEYDFPDQIARRDAILNLLHKMKSQNVPVQAFGLQAHLYGAAGSKMNTNAIASFLKSISDMGLKILITELDVEDQGVPANSRDQVIADAYHTFLGTALANPNVIVVETWGLSDKYSWLKTHAPRKDGLDVRVLPLDATFNSKPAYQAIAQAFDAAPARTV
jgi:endo-1,4-beta-xylanase